MLDDVVFGVLIGVLIGVLFDVSAACTVVAWLMFLLHITYTQHEAPVPSAYPCRSFVS